MPSILTTLCVSAFHSCTSLTEMIIPTRVPVIGAYCFSGSTALRIIECLGNAPAIGAYAFDDVIAAAYCPISNPTWTSDVMQD